MPTTPSTTDPQPRPGLPGRVRWLTIAGGLAVVLALSAFAINRTTTPIAADNPQARTTDSAAASGSDPLRLETVEGGSITLPSDKPTLLYFMASWCASCIIEARSMTALEDQYADQATFVAVETTPNAATSDIEKFRAAANNPTHPYVLDRRGELVERYKVVTLDTTVLIGPDGNVIARADGQPLDETILKAFLDDNL